MNGYNIDPTLIEAAITKKTKAIFTVHLYGQPCDIDEILSIASQHGLRVIEDAAQAHCATYKGNRIGGHSDVVTWSFYPAKNLGAFGDGGAVITDDAQIAAAIRLLGIYGASKKYEHDVLGINNRVDPLQAELDVKLEHLDSRNQCGNEVAGPFCAELAGLDGIEPPIFSDKSSWHLFVIRSNKRDVLCTKIVRNGVGYGIHYPKDPHRQEPYRGSHTRTDL